jgi:putative membrane protein
MDHAKTDSPQASGIPDHDPRVQLATERTLLAWIRTGLALMAFGFVVARFAILLQSLGVKTDSRVTLAATVIGIVMVLLGVIANAGASLRYRTYFQRIERQGEKPFSAWSLAVWVALASAVIGGLLVLYLLMVDVSSWTLSHTLNGPID